MHKQCLKFKKKNRNKYPNRLVQNSDHHIDSIEICMLQPEWREESIVVSNHQLDGGSSIFCIFANLWSMIRSSPAFAQPYYFNYVIIIKWLIKFHAVSCLQHSCGLNHNHFSIPILGKTSIMLFISLELDIKKINSFTICLLWFLYFHPSYKKYTSLHLFFKDWEKD